MKTIDINMLETVTGGTLTTALNTSGISRPELHMLNKLNRTLTNLGTTQQNDSSQTAMLLCCAMLARRS